MFEENIPPIKYVVKHKDYNFIGFVKHRVSHFEKMLDIFWLAIYNKVERVRFN